MGVPSTYRSRRAFVRKPSFLSCDLRRVGVEWVKCGCTGHGAVGGRGGRVFHTSEVGGSVVQVRNCKEPSHCGGDRHLDWEVSRGRK